MVILETNFTELNKAIGKKLTKKELEDTLFDLGMELERTEKDEIRIEITPDRPDLLSTQGLGRALKAYLGIKTGLREYKIKKSEIKINVDKSVEKVRPYTVAAAVKNLKLDYEKIKEIINIQEKLHNTFARKRKKTSIGIYPLENISPPITYLAEKSDKIKFVPLDFEKELTGKEILEKHPTGIKYADLLKSYDKYPIFVDSKNKVLSMPPIINSQELGKVNDKTKDIFIECSGHDINASEQVLNLIVTTLADMGGEIYSVEVNYGNKKMITPNLEPEKKEIKLSYINKILGLELKSKDAIELLKRMGYDASGTDKIRILIPKYRTDIWHDIDIVDDVARAYGFNNMKPTFPKVHSVAETIPEHDFLNRLKELIIGLGYNETFTFGLTSKDDQFRKMNTKPCPSIELGSVKEQTINMVRVWLLPELLKFLVNNRSREYPQRIFEVNDVVVQDSKEDIKSKNVTRLCCVSAHEKANFTEIKQVLDYLGQVLNLNLRLEELRHDSFIEGRCASILLNEKEIGFMGEINPIALNNFDLQVPVCALELDAEKLLG